MRPKLQLLDKEVWFTKYKRYDLLNITIKGAKYVSMSLKRTDLPAMLLAIYVR